MNWRGIARTAIAIIQLETTLTGTEPNRRTTHDAGTTINEHGTAFTKSNREPDTESTAVAQIPASTDSTTAANRPSPRRRYTLASVAMTAIQQPRKTPSSQARGTGKRLNTADVASR